MIENNNPEINVEGLMAKVFAEVARRRQTHAADGGVHELPPDALASVASIESSIQSAEEKAQVRTVWSGRLNRFPFNSNSSLQRFFLKALAFVFKDQRHVNFALIQALRDTLTMNVRLAEQVDQLRARLNRIEDRTKNREALPGRNGPATQ